MQICHFIIHYFACDEQRVTKKLQPTDLITQECTKWGPVPPCPHTKHPTNMYQLLQFTISVKTHTQPHLVLKLPTRLQITFHLCVCAQSLRRVQLFVAPWTAQPTRLLCPWDSPDKNTGLGCQGIFLTQRVDPCLLHSCILHWQADSLILASPGKPNLPSASSQ